MGLAETIDEIVENFEKQRSIYDKFSKKIKLILEEKLVQEKIPILSIQGRAKDSSSLKNKLIKKPGLIHKEIQDLAGCRIIFYFEEDMKKFANLLVSEFKIEDRKDKISPDDYNSIHLIIKLNDERANLTEYKEYKTLLCEIQLTTSLFHSWSEVNHDIIYKKDHSLEEFCPEDFKFIEKKLKETMFNHIRKANDNFTYVSHMFNELKKGQKIINQDNLEKVLVEGTNEEIISTLKELISLLPKFRMPQDFEIFELIRSLINEFSSTDGDESIEIKNLSFKILGLLRYGNYKKTIDFAINNLQENKHIGESLLLLKNISEYNLNVMDHLRYLPQNYLIQKLNKLYGQENPSKEIIEILGDLLSNSVQGDKMDGYNKITLIQGVIPINPDLKIIRSTAIRLLGSFLKKDSITDKILIINSIFECSSPMHSGKPSQNHYDLISENLKEVFKVINEEYDKFSNLAKRELKMELIRLKRHEEYDISSKLNSLLKKIEDDEDFQKFKVFVGHEVDDFDKSYSESKKERDGKIESFVEEINAGNISSWKIYLSSIIVDYDSNPGLYQGIHDFLRILAEKKQGLSDSFLSDDDFDKFKISLLIGSLLSSNEGQVNTQINSMIDSDNSLFEISEALLKVNDFNIDLLKKLIEKFFISPSPNIGISLLRVILKQYEKYKELKNSFLEIIRELTNLKEFNWAHDTFYIKSKLLEDLESIDYNEILNNLKNKQNIDYHEEEIINELIKKDPLKVISFFFKRVKIYEETRNIDRPVPFRFQKIQVPDEEAKKVFLEIFKWMDEGVLVQWEAGNLVSNLFPTIDGKIKEIIIEIIRKKDDSELKKLFKILQKYDGDKDILDLAKEILINSQKTKKLYEKIFRLLSFQSFWTGEYGLIEIYKAKIEEINPWLAEEELEDFAKEYISHLENRIKYETARVEKEKEFMQDEFNSVKNRFESP